MAITYFAHSLSPSLGAVFIIFMGGLAIKSSIARELFGWNKRKTGCCSDNKGYYGPNII